MDLYSLRRASQPFLLASTVVVTLPASRTTAALAASLCLLLILANQRFERDALRVAGAVASIAIVYGLRTMTAPGLALASAAICALFAYTAAVGRPGRTQIEIRAIAFCELFVYASALALILGLEPSNENRRYLTSTVGTERFSFLFAAGASQAAMVAAAAVILALSAAVKMAPLRRLALGFTGLVLVWGANYRFILVVLVAVAIYAWRTGTLRIARPAGKSIMYTALALSALPLWWTPLTSVVARPLATIVSEVPGLGSRNETLDEVGEISSLNGRVEVWAASHALLRRAPITELFAGFGATGGDADFHATITKQFGTTFIRTDTISSHNSWLDQLRRAGMIGAGILAIQVFVFVMSRQRLSRGAYGTVAFLLAAGGADISVLPVAGAPLALTLAICAPAVSARWREHRLASRATPTASAPIALTGGLG